MSVAEGTVINIKNYGRPGVVSNNWTLQRSIEKITAKKMEAMSTPDYATARTVSCNAFYDAMFYAFSKHLSLCLTPDDLWTMIARGLASCINAEPEKYRHLFVEHEGKKEIRIRRDEFGMGNPNNDWMGCFDEFKSAIATYVGEEMVATLNPSFSTSTPISQAASTISLMDSVQSYFSYVVETRCGIPAVKLLGTLEDWQKLKKCVIDMRKFDLDWWWQYVFLIVDQCEQAVAGSPDLHFWKDIYKYEAMSGDDAIGGHFLKLMPYLADGTKNPCVEKNACINSAQLAASVSTVPFIWDYYGQLFDYYFIGGHFGVSCNQDSDFVRPVMGWAVCPKPV